MRATGTAAAVARDVELEVLLVGDPGDAALDGYRLKLELDGYVVTQVGTSDDLLRRLATRRPDLVFVAGRPAHDPGRVVDAILALAPPRPPVLAVDAQRLRILYPETIDTAPLVLASL